VGASISVAPTPRGLRDAFDPPARFVRLMLGLVLGGVSIAFQIEADLGAAPWSVLDQGIARWASLPVGTTSVIVGAVVLLMWFPLGERLGIGTVLNVVVIGAVCDLVLLVLDTPSHLGARLGCMAFGVALWGPVSGLYIGSRLGPGPRDGLMTGLATRGLGSIRLIRTGLELGALAAGWLLGGTIGVGTLTFALTIGPNVQFCLEKLSVPSSRSPGLVPQEPHP
jgi:uncharacterized membrane protein YczE